MLFVRTNSNYNLVMKPISFIILSLFTILIQSQTCTNVYPFQQSTCLFYFTPSDNCSTLNFHFCTWQQCLSYRSTNNKYCAQSVQIRADDWDECTAQCCDGSVKYPQIWDSLSQCQTFINQSSSESTAASAAILATIILAVIISICCICSCCRGSLISTCCKSFRECICQLLCCERCKTVAEVSSVHNVSQEGLPGHHANGIKEISKNENEWRYVSPFEGSEGRESLEMITCCICLENRPTLELECGHTFHKLCIKECLKKKLECPLCRAIHIDNIRLYCESCFRAYLCSTLREYFSVRVCLSFSCPGCMLLGEVRG